MKITSHTDPFPFLYIENLYTEEELRLIFTELDYYQSNQKILNLNTHSATDADGNSKSKEKVNFLTISLEIGNIQTFLNINRKLFERV